MCSVATKGLYLTRREITLLKRRVLCGFFLNAVFVGCVGIILGGQCRGFQLAGFEFLLAPDILCGWVYYTCIDEPIILSLITKGDELVFGARHAHIEQAAFFAGCF